MNGKANWKEVTLAEVLKALDARAPDWAMRLADQQDFKDALRLDTVRGKELLRSRASEKVWMVAGACVKAMVEKKESASNPQTQEVWMLEEDVGCGYLLLPAMFATEEVARASWELSWDGVPESERPPYRVTCMQVYAAPRQLGG